MTTTTKEHTSLDKNGRKRRIRAPKRTVKPKARYASAKLIDETISASGLSQVAFAEAVELRKVLPAHLNHVSIQTRLSAYATSKSLAPFDLIVAVNEYRGKCNPPVPLLSDEDLLVMYERDLKTQQAMQERGRRIGGIRAAATKNEKRQERQGADAKALVPAQAPLKGMARPPIVNGYEPVIAAPLGLKSIEAIVRGPKLRPTSAAVAQAFVRKIAARPEPLSLDCVVEVNLVQLCNMVQRLIENERARDGG
jgi:hypothetical protein